MPQEMDLERLISGVSKPHESWSSRTPACQWIGIECNLDEQVTKIFWARRSLRGHLNFSHIPISVLRFDVEENMLTGGVFLSGLSPLVNLKDSIIGRNEFTGNPDLTVLPQNLSSTWMEQNKLSGEVCLTQLPTELKHLDISCNELTGNIDLRSLPSTLRSLYMNQNLFEGIVDLSHLPQKLDDFFIDDNELLEGTIMLSSLPANLKGEVLRMTRNTKLIVASESLLG